MTDAPLFTVIVPTYDRPTHLAEALESVRRQTVSDWECVVVDDASPTPASLPADHRFRVIRLERNGGETVARNEGLRAATGTYLVFLDDDDVYTPDRLKHAIHGLAKGPVSVCWRRGFDGSTGGNRLLEGDVRHRILDGLTPHLGQVTIRRSDAPWFDEAYETVGDVEWWLRVSEASRISTVPRIGLLYRHHAGPRNRNGLRARLEGSLQLLDHHAEYFARHPRAAAFRWKRIGLLASRLGNFRLARTAFVRSLGLRPQLSTSWHLVRALRPSNGRDPTSKETSAA